MKCNQTNCDKPAAFRFTWPGRDEAGICMDHAPKLVGVSVAMGLYLQMIPVNVESDDERKAAATVEEAERG